MDTLLTFLQKKYIRQLDCNLRFLLDQYSIEELVKDIVGWLKTDSLNYFDTTTFARDFIIGSNLTEQEKRVFYDELVRQGFFKQLEVFLYSKDFSVCSWTIYTIGKFSENENALFLETAYEANYKLTNPILSYRCLSELDWLNSNKFEGYLKELELDNSWTSKLVLFYYWAPRSYSSKFKDLLKDKAFIGSIIPNIDIVDIEGEVSNRLFAFENYITELYNDIIKIEKQDFEKIAKSFFTTYENTTDEQADKDHDEFLKLLRAD